MKRASQSLSPLQKVLIEGQIRSGLLSVDWARARVSLRQPCISSDQLTQSHCPCCSEARPCLARALGQTCSPERIFDDYAVWRVVASLRPPEVDLYRHSNSLGIDSLWIKPHHDKALTGERNPGIEHHTLNTPGAIFDDSPHPDTIIPDSLTETTRVDEERHL